MSLAIRTPVRPFGVPDSYCASSGVTLSPYLLAVQELEGSISGPETMSQDRFFLAAGRLHEALQGMSVPAERIGMVHREITSLQALATRFEFNPIAAQAFLEQLRQQNILPKPNEDPRQVARRLGGQPQTEKLHVASGVLQRTILLAQRVRDALGTVFVGFGIQLKTHDGPEQAGPTLALPVSRATERGHLLVRGQMLVGGRKLMGSVVTDYALGEEVGRGGSASVYKGIESSTGRPVAIKIVNVADPSEHAAILERFEHEMTLQVDLESDRMVRTYTSGTTAIGEPFLVMEYLPWGDLDNYLDDVAESRVAFDAEKALQIGIQAVASAAEMHRRGIIHRDIKPGNFLFTEGRQRLKIADFGIAEKKAGLQGNRSERFAGTIGFIPLETYYAQQDTFQRDVFALGVVLYQLLTGQMPFPTLNVSDQIKDMMDSTPPAPSSFHPPGTVSSAIDRIVLKALSRHAGDRYKDAEGLLFDLLTHKAQALEDEAREIFGREPVLAVDSRIRRTRWSQLTQEALREYERVYDQFPTGSIRNKILELNEALYRWADRMGHDDLRVKAGEAIASLAPSSEAARHVRQPVLVQFVMDDLPPDVRPHLSWVRYHHSNGFIVPDKVVGEDEALPQEAVEFARGSLFGIQFEAPGCHPVCIPLPVRSGFFTVRIPVYPASEIPANFALIPAGPVAVREQSGSYSEQLLKWREVDHDFAIGPLVTIGEWIDFARTVFQSGKSQVLKSLMASGLKLNLKERLAFDAAGRPMDLQTPITGISHAAARLYLATMYPEQNARLPTLDEWKRAMRGNDARMWPWGDASPEPGIAGFRFPGHFERRGALPNNLPGVLDVSPFSLPLIHSGTRLAIPFMASNVRRFLHMDDPQRMFQAAGMGDMDLEDPGTLASWVLTVGESHDSPAPVNPDIIRLEPADTTGPIGFMPVLPLRYALPTPAIDQVQS